MGLILDSSVLVAAERQGYNARQTDLYRSWLTNSGNDGAVRLAHLKLTAVRRRKPWPALRKVWEPFSLNSCQMEPNEGPYR
jgi:hypothetical protein